MEIFTDTIPESHLVFWIGELPNNKEGDLVSESAKIYEIVEKLSLFVIGTGTDTFNSNVQSSAEGDLFKFQSSCYSTFVNSVTGSTLPAIEKLEAKFR